MFSEIRQRLKGGRTGKLLTNVSQVVVIRVLLAIVSFVIVPIQIDIVGNNLFGVWQTISSLMLWLLLFDFGVGNSYRNLFTQAVTVNDKHELKSLISTVFFILAAFGLALILLLQIVFPYLNLAALLNVTELETQTMFWVYQWVALGVVLKLVFTFFTNALLGGHQYGLNTLIELLGLGILFLIFYFAKNTFTLSFSWFVALMVLIPLLVSLLVMLYVLARGTVAFSLPKFANFDTSIARKMLKQGFMFWLLQMSFVAFFSSNNILISQILGPSYVTEYSLVTKLFSIPTILSSIILGPLWSGFTEAWHKKDFPWIHVTIKRLLMFWLFMIMLIGVIVLFNKEIFYLWVKNRVFPDVSTVIILGLITALTIINNIMGTFFNGVGVIRMQMLLSMLILVVNIPLAILLGSYFKLGLPGILLANLTCIIINSLVSWRQVKLLMNQEAKGIWAK